MSVMSTALGMLEFRSVAKGIEAADAMLKAADSSLLIARTVCPGKYLVVVEGEVAAVKSSVVAGTAGRQEYLVDELLLANVHGSVLPAIAGANPVPALASLGIIETFSAAACLEAADIAAKAADVTLIEIRLPAGMGGKAYVTLTGTVSAVSAAVEAGAASAADKGLLLERVVIPAPAADLEGALL